MTVFCMLILAAFVKSHSQHFVFNVVFGILGVVMCSSTLKIEYKHEKLEELRQSVILETGSRDLSILTTGSRRNHASQVKKLEKERIIDMPERKIVLNLDDSIGKSPEKRDF